MRLKRPTRIQIGVLTHNPMATMRFGLLEGTIASLREAFPEEWRSGAEHLLAIAYGGPKFPEVQITIFDNGSTDGTAAWLAGEREAKRLHGYGYVPEDGNTSPGRGENELVKMLTVQARLSAELGDGVRWRDADLGIFVLSDDDMRWKPGAAAKLRRFWAEAPEDLVIVAGLLEPEWHWNTPRETVEHGGVRALVRDSAPNAAWTFRARDRERIFPLVEDFGQDYDACQRLAKAGLRVAQMDLAEHVGWGLSTHGNDAIDEGKPLDRERWGV